MKTKPRFKKGDKCKVIADTSGHDFEIGEEVTIVKRMKNEVNPDQPYYKCDNGKDYWYVDELDLEPLN